jgi:hypothetical protein
METDSLTVKVPPAMLRLAGTLDPGTRIFRRDGSQDEMTEWFDAVCEHIGPCVSPGGAAAYAGVTRAGVYRRMKAGGMTAFCFHIVGEKKTFFGGVKRLKQFPLVYIPVSECQAWRKNMEERIQRIEASKNPELSAEDAAAFADTDPGDRELDSTFLEYDPKDKGKKIHYVDLPFDDSVKEPVSKKGRSKRDRG